jgi:N-acetylmuramoyl-L-alanine amidase
MPGYQEQLPEVIWFQRKLAEIGYAVPQTGELDQATRNVISVFQTKYRPALFDGTPDAETAAMMDVLTTPVPAVPAAPPVVAAPAAAGTPTE